MGSHSIKTGNIQVDTVERILSSSRADCCARKETDQEEHARQNGTRDHIDNPSDRLMTISSELEERVGLVDGRQVANSSGNT